MSKKILFKKLLITLKVRLCIFEFITNKNVLMMILLLCIVIWVYYKQICQSSKIFLGFTKFLFIVIEHK